MRELSLTQEDIIKDAHHTNKKLSQTQQLLNKTRRELNVVAKSTLNITVSIDNYIDQLFLKNSSFGGHTYLLSRPVLVDVLKFNSICMIKGGYLVEIDDVDEFNFVTSFFTSVYAPTGPNLIISMTDFGHKGSWKYINSGQPVTYVNWFSKPSSGTGYDCAFIHSSTKKMFSCFCLDTDVKRFMCEIPA